MIDIDGMWRFLNNTFVGKSLLEVIDPDTSAKIPLRNFLYHNGWEFRFDFDKLEKLWDSGHTFIVQSSCANKVIREYVESLEIEKNVNAQAHIYAGKYGSKSFPIHCDVPDNIIVQCVGKSKVTVYNEYDQGCESIPLHSDLTVKEQTILEPGQSISIPSLQYHHFQPLTDRLSISFPMMPN